MPIEIKELHIKINVKGGDQKPQSDGGKVKGLWWLGIKYWLALRGQRKILRMGRLTHL